MKPKPITFRISVAARHVPHYFGVYIHRSRKSFERARVGKNKRLVKSTAQAFFQVDSVKHTLFVRADGKELNCPNVHIGDLHFERSLLTFNLIAHEIFHAVICFARSVSVDFMDKDDEERCAELAGNLMSDFLSGIQDKLKGRISSYTLKPNKNYWK